MKRFESSTNFPERAAAVEWHLGRKWRLSQKKTATGQKNSHWAKKRRLGKITATGKKKNGHWAKRNGHWTKKTATGQKKRPLGKKQADDSSFFAM